MAKHRDGQKLIVPIRLLYHQKRLRLIVPSLVVEEFERNRPRVEASVSASVAERVRQLKNDLNEYGGEQREQWLEEMSHRLPLLSSLSLRNFTEIQELLSHPAAVKPSSRQQASVVRRALEKKAPFHLAKNSVADALLIEIFRDAVKKSRPSDVCYFATSNHQDFSLPHGDRRKPHPDFEDVFGVFEVNGARGGSGSAGVAAPRMILEGPPCPGTEKRPQSLRAACGPCRARR
jgi:hypothetical protein